MLGNKDDYKEAVKGGTFLGFNIIVWVTFLFILSVIFTSAYLLYERWYQNRLTDITRQTNQYITTQQTNLSTWADEYNDNIVRIMQTEDYDVKEALLSSNVALCERMRMTASRIDNQYVPSSARTILQGGCQ